MECKTCGSGHGFMLLGKRYLQIGNGNLLPDMITLVPTVCNCCGGYWENCKNCSAGKRIINWVSPDEWNAHMWVWLEDNIGTIIKTNNWISFSSYIEVDTLEDFMGWLNRVAKPVKKMAEGTDMDVEKSIPGNYKKDVTVLARRTRLSLVQIQYNRSNMTLEQARLALKGNLSPDDPSTYYDDSHLLQLKENDKDENE